MRDMSQNNFQGTESVQKPRLMYLDVDDTLLVWTNKVRGFAAPRADDFIRWALEHFEVRWLTMWCPDGHMHRKAAEELSYRFNSTILPETFQKIYNPKSFINKKTDGIDFDDPRPWVWVEDSMVTYEILEMNRRNKIDNFYPTNVSHNAVMLQSTWRKLAKRFDLTGTPDMPFTTKTEIPVTPMTVNELIYRFRDGKTRRITRALGYTESLHSEHSP